MATPHPLPKVNFFFKLNSEEPSNNDDEEEDDDDDDDDEKNQEKNWFRTKYRIVVEIKVEGKER